MSRWDTDSVRRVFHLMERSEDTDQEINLTQAWDYHLVEEIGVPRQYAADSRGVSSDAVRNSIRAVERALGIRDGADDAAEEGTDD